MKKAISYSPALRFRSIWSEDRPFQVKVDELAGWLMDRDYEESLVNEQMDRVLKVDTTSILGNVENRTNSQGRGERVPHFAIGI